MARQIINNSPGTADSLKVGADKINEMTAELYVADAVAATASLRTLGTGPQQACAGNDSRLFSAAIFVEGADPTGATLSNTAFTTAVRRANGLADDGTGTRSAIAQTVIIPAGQYLLQNWAPTDAAGDPLSTHLFAFPGSVKLMNRLGGPGSAGTAAGINFNLGPYQHANRVQQQVTAVELAQAIRTFGLPTDSSSDDVVAVLTVSSVAGFKLNAHVHIVCKEILPFTSVTSTDVVRIAEIARILDIDTVNNKIYLHKPLDYQAFYETEIYVTQYNEDVKFSCENIEFTAAPTTVGNTTATPQTLDHGLWGTVQNPVTSLTKSGTTATLVCTNPHNLVTGNTIRVQGANEPIWNITAKATVVNSTTFTYPLVATSDNNETFSPTIAATANTATGTIYYNDAFPNYDTLTHSRVVHLNAVVSPQFKNCKVTYPWNQGIAFVGCPNWYVQDFENTGSPNHGTVVDSARYNGGRLGYGIIAYGPSGLGKLNGAVYRNARHAVTFDELQEDTYDPTNGNASSVWYRLGGSNSCDIMNALAYDAWGIPFDEHEGSTNIRFINCHSIDASRGPGGGSYSPAGFQLRGRESSAIDCSVKGGSYGIRVSAIQKLGTPFRTSNGTSTFTNQTFSVTTLTQTGGVATFVLSATGTPTLEVGQMVRIRGANQANYNVYAPVTAWDQTTRTGTYTLPTRDDYNVLFPTAPASAVTPATGTITLMPFARTNHVVANFKGETNFRGRGSLIWTNAQNGLPRWKNRVTLAGDTFGRLMPNVVRSEADCEVYADNITGTQLFFGTSSNQTESGSVIATTGSGICIAKSVTIDATENINNATALWPVKMEGTSRCYVGDLTVIQSRSRDLTVPRVFHDNDNLPGKSVGLGRLSYVNQSGFTGNFQIIQPGREGNFLWLGGGQDISLPIFGATSTVPSTPTNNAYFRRTGGAFVVREWIASTRTSAVNVITPDVKLNGSTVFGAKSLTVPIGFTNSESSTTITSASDGQVLPQSTINVASTTNFPTSGTVVIAGSVVTYSGKTSTTFTGCTGGSGTLRTGQYVNNGPVYSTMFLPAGSVLTVDVTSGTSETAQALEVVASGYWV